MISRLRCIACPGLALLAGCLPFAGGGADRMAETVEGDPEWVTQVVASVFREVDIPVQAAEPGSVVSGDFRVADDWQSARVEDRVACGPDGDIPLFGELVELRVDAWIADASVAPAPGVLPPPPGETAPRETGRRSRVAVTSSGRMLTGAGARCALRASFAEQILARVVARTGRREIVADGPRPGGR